MKTILLALGLLLFTWSAARACSCVGESTSEKAQISRAYRRDDVILIGRVVGVEIITSSDTLHARSPRTGRDTVYTRGTQQHRYTLAVARVLKGAPLSTTVLVTTASSGAACGVTLKTGVDYLLHASVIDQEATMRGVVQSVLPYYGTSICHRTRELKHVRRGELRQLQRLSRSA